MVVLVFVVVVVLVLVVSLISVSRGELLASICASYIPPGLPLQSCLPFVSLGLQPR